MIDNLYLWVKAAHMLSVIAWMAGMLYLPRLYVYHAGVQPGSEASELFKVMERKLLRLIINPALIAAWGFGIWLVVLTGAGSPGSGHWMHAKFALLIAMMLTHAAFARWRKDFAKDQNKHSARFYRIMNEVPAVLAVGIVLLVVLKPF